jgi:hypothetical protein
MATVHVFVQLISLVVLVSCGTDILQFIHVTDFHYDAKYDRYEGDTRDLCHTNKTFDYSVLKEEEYFILD